jgi:acetyl coenzyme A synthetase (ADP forming)-like protein
MKNFFEPRSVVVVGVSKEKGKIGNVIFRNLREHFKTIPVNMHEEEILGVKCYHSVSDIKEKIDLAVIAVPAEFVIQVVKECGEKKIKEVIIISSGFKEIGNERLEYELLKTLETFKIKCIGPNCLGVFDAHSGMDCMFLPQDKLKRPLKGGISFVSQSGALGAAMLDVLADGGYGFSKFISYGNGLNLGETDFLEFLGEDKNTKVICMYIEGIKDGKKFLKIASKIKKPIIAVKGGKFSKGAKAIMSHTGSLAGQYEVYKGALKQAGIVLVDSLEEMFDTAKMFEKIDPNSKKRIQIVTNGGGYGVLMSDALEENKLDLAEMCLENKKILREKFPKSVSIGNPIDLLGDADIERYKTALDICDKDKNIDIIILILLLQTPKIDEEIVEVARNVKKPVIVVSTGSHSKQKIAKNLERAGMPVYAYTDQVAKALKNVKFHNKL